MSSLSGLFRVGAAGPIKALGNIYDSLFSSDEARDQAKLMKNKIEKHPT